MHRFFIDRLESDQLIVTDPVDVHQLKKVVRVRPGEPVELVYQEKLYLGELMEVGREAIFKQLKEQAVEDSGVRISLIQGYPKGSKMSEILMHGTECGIEHFVIAQMDRSIARLDPTKRDRYERIVKDAAKQSKRLSIPRISFEELSGIDFSQYDRVYFLFEGSKTPLATDSTDRSIALVIGPEGGFSDQEIDLLRSLPNVAEATLGQRIYRTETAGLVACVIIRDRLEAR
ncbi:MAG TPA: 16S rRNA (uracil(1498)-N(3))-methyltransferase [Tissierellia bacterium]|nr:16S rRNA (uracil(1498)-N(3))-methyltransferase [Tissierellia bacterium]